MRGAIKPFIGYDRAKVFTKVPQERAEKLKESNKKHKSKK